MSTATQLPFEVRYHEGTRRHYLYLDAGTDPGDGQPLTLCRPARPHEVRLWQAGRYQALARSLGVSLPEKPGLFGRMREALFGRRS